MKKKSIILSVATCCFAAFTACDMDLASETSIPISLFSLSRTVENIVICFMRNGVAMCKIAILWMRWYSPD
mgnify:CR=1 FL=1